MGYVFGSSLTSPRINIDHVWETQLLTKFFESLNMGFKKNPDFTCKQFGELFDQLEDEGNPDLGSRLQQTYAALPSWKNPDFVGMDADLNTKKVRLWGASNPMMSTKKKLAQGILIDIRDFTLLTLILQDQDVRALWDASSNRIYKRFQQIDQVIMGLDCANKPIKMEGPIKGETEIKNINPNWAFNYKKWMNKYISGQNKKLTAALTGAVADFEVAIQTPPTPADTALYEGLKLKHQNWQSKYRIEQLTVSAANWPAAAAKRSVDAPACMATLVSLVTASDQTIPTTLS